MLSLDHVGVVGPSIIALRSSWSARGFSVTEPEELMALDAATGRRVSLGQHSCHIIFERGYIELTAVDPVTPTHHLHPWIGDPSSRGEVSLSIIAMGSDDIDAVHARLSEARLPVGAIAQASRPIHYGARRGDALFRWFMLGATTTPEALVCVVRNERPELIFQPEVQRHPNGARALESVIICSQDPAATAARYAGYSGATAVAAGAGLFRCPLRDGVIWVGTAAAVQEHFGHAVAHSPGDAPRAIGFGVAPDQVYWVSAGMPSVSTSDRGS